MITEPVVLAGPGVASYLEIYRRESGRLPATLPAVEVAPDGAVVALLAMRRLQNGAGDDVLALTPLYLKESTARAFFGRYDGSAPAKG